MLSFMMISFPISLYDLPRGFVPKDQVGKVCQFEKGIIKAEAVISNWFERFSHAMPRYEPKRC